MTAEMDRYCTCQTSHSDELTIELVAMAQVDRDEFVTGIERIKTPELTEWLATALAQLDVTSSLGQGCSTAFFASLMLCECCECPVQSHQWHAL
jgi:hypothetical protein